MLRRAIFSFIGILFLAAIVHYAFAADGSGTGTVSPSSTLVGTTNNTLRFVYTATETMDGGVITLTAPSGWTAPQGTSGTAGYTIATTSGTIGNVFDNADQLGSWVASGACSGGLSLDTTPAEVRAGTGSIKCINTNSDGPPNGVWYNTFSTPQDWSTYTTVGFSIYSSADISNSNLKFDYSANATLSTSNASIESLNLGTISLTAGTWKYISFPLSSSVTKSAVRSYGFRIANASVKGSTIIVDNFLVGATNITLTPSFSGSTATVNALTLANGQTVNFVYGSGGGTSAATATSTPGTSTFTIKTKTTDSGTLTNIASLPSVTVLDTTVPTVSLTAPTTGSTVHGSSVSLTSTASDNVAVAGVTYYLSGVRLGSEVASPYTSTFDSTTKTDGSYSLVAVARDSSSNYATSTAATITIDNTGPVQSSIASSTTATTATVTWTTNESSNSKVSYGTSSGTYTLATSSASLVTSHSIGLTSLSDSTLYYYVVVAVDASGNTSTSTEKTLRTLDITAPTVSVTSPTNGATLVGSSVSLAATASDNVAVAGVTFYVDTTRIGTEDTTASYTGTLDSTTLVDGTHSIIAVVRDTSNNYATSTAISITVDNPAPQLSAVSVASNNASTTLAIVGNALTLSFTSNQSLRSATVTIAGHTVSIATTSSTIFTANYTMTSGDTEGSVAFSIAPSNLSGRSGFTTSTTTDATRVVFDKTAPTNQDTVFPTAVSKRGGVTVTVVSSGDSTNKIWFAPAGTTVFSAGSTMTTAAGNATSLLAPTTSGTYYLYIIDAAGNISVHSIATLTVDNTSPTLSSVVLSTSNTSGSFVKSGDTVTVTFTASKTINVPSVSFTAGGAPVTSVVVVTNTSGNTWTASYVADTHDTNGAIAFSIDGLEDTLGNVATAVTVTSDASSLTFDGTTPSLSSVNLSSNNASTTVSKVNDVITLTFSASESISIPSVSFTSGGQAVTDSASVTSLGGNNWRARYTTNTSDTEGSVAYVISGIHDQAGNNGSTVTSGSGRVSFDKTSPTLVIATRAGDPTAESPIEVTATFSEAVTGFGASSIHVGNGMAGNLAGSGADYTFDVTPSGNGLVTVDVDVGASIDAAGNTSQAPSQLTRVFSSTRPTVMLSSHANHRLKSPHITVTVVFSAGVAGISTSTFASSVRNGAVTAVTGSGDTYTITLVPDSEGTVEVSVPEAVTVDTETNANENFASAPISFVYDVTPPGLAEHAAPQALSRSHAQSYSFSSDEEGTYEYTGGCGTGTGSAAADINSVSFSDLSDGTYSNCKVIVTDEAGNVSDELDIDPFTIDTTAPAISHTATTPASSNARAAWNTNEAASTQVVYGLTSAYSSSTPEIDTGTRISSHETTLPNLISCATYHYAASSTDEAGNSNLGTDQTFTTQGCAGDASVISQNAASVSRSAGGTVSLISSGSGISLSVPANFSDANAHFQIKKLDKTAALGVLGAPTTYENIGNYVYDLHALSDVETAISSFDHPLTVTLNYTTADVSGIDEASLQIFRNDAGVWTALSSCSVDTSARSVTCNTDHFSTFSIFGHEGTTTPTPETTSETSTQSSVSVQAQVKALIGMGKQESARELMLQWPNIFPQTSNVNTQRTVAFNKDIAVGSSGDDVRMLQKFLNSHGYVITRTGPGSAGNESVLFGALTRKALAKFQAAHGISPATGYFGSATRSLVSSMNGSSIIMPTPSASVVAPVSASATQTVRDLTVGMSGDDVRKLQKLLIAQGYQIPAGVTGYFSVQTKAALGKYQLQKSIVPPVGYFGIKTRSQMKAAGLTGLWW